MIKSRVGEQKFRGKMWLKGKPFLNADWTKVYFLAAASKAICLRLEPFNRSMELKLCEPATPSPGHLNHPRFVRRQQWEWVLTRSGNVNQKGDVILGENTLIRMIVYCVCFEQEEVWYLLIKDNAPEAMRENSSGQVSRNPQI